jgi:uncharacterized membrane protein YoaK (UPF0700 family)
MAWTAGFLDVFGWLTLSHVYTSHMTGNTAFFAIRIATQTGRSRGSFSIALGTEITLLIAFIVTGARYGAALLPPALGMQTVTITRVAGLRVYTTYLTGSLSKFAEAAIEYAFWFRDRTRGRFSKRIGRVLRVTPRVP